ncbi:MAG: hypothetical protein JO020_31305 [Chloroflexi bacterium]|nr:hypothetical protein [Chloroflexota bacterium]MBV9898664.1 hypothetical protein [Chloroflexota bacterium]
MTGVGKRQLPLVLTIVAIATAGFGLGFIVAPTQIWSLYGVQLDAEGAFVARMFGTANVGVGLLLWWARSAFTAGLQSGLLGALSAWSIARMAVTSTALATGLTNGAGWIFVLYDMALLVIYALVAVANRRASDVAEPLTVV